MKEESSDQQIQLLMKNFSIQHPKLKCSSGNQITNVCQNTNCQPPALYCNQSNCTSCFKTHMMCENVSLYAFTHLLQKRAQGQRQFIIKIFQLENQMIQQIQRKSKETIQKFYLGDLEKKYLGIIESVYISKDQKFQLSGKDAEQIYAKLKKNESKSEVAEPEKTFLQGFQKWFQRLAKQLNATKNKFIEKYIKNPKAKVEEVEVNLLKGSKILTKDHADQLEFLKQSFRGVKRFQLLFRASQNEFKASKFHEKCDGVKHTFTIMKNQYGKILGGYTPLKWNEVQENNFAADNQGLSFLLSFNLRQKMNLIRKQSAIFNRSDIGPAFGGGFDLGLCDRCNLQSDSFAHFPGSYNYNNLYHSNLQTRIKFSGKFNFKVIEYEVYRVVW